jgi:hypothetical protein
MEKLYMSAVNKKPRDNTQLNFQPALLYGYEMWILKSKD